MDRNGKCIKCKCDWKSHKNVPFVIESTELTKWIVPKELIKLWNKKTTTIEGAALDALNEFLDLHKELTNAMNMLMELTAQLRNVALKHNPEACLTYLEGLVKEAEQNGRLPGELRALRNARESLRIGQVSH